MRCARRFPLRLVRWTSLCVSLAVIATSLTIILLQPARGRGSITLMQDGNGQGNDHGKKTDAPKPRGQEARLPGLEEGQHQNEAPRARPDVPSTIRSPRKPLESRQGRKVGDPLPRKASTDGKGSGDFDRGSERVSGASADAHKPVGNVRSHHVRAARSLPRGPSGRNPSSVISDWSGSPAKAIRSPALATL
jgi:hypothetical protein